jgi:hypothetical protein
MRISGVDRRQEFERGPRTSVLFCNSLLGNKGESISIQYGGIGCFVSTEILMLPKSDVDEI